MRRSDAVYIRWTKSHDKVTGVNHTQIRMHGGPKGLGATNSRCSANSTGQECPFGALGSRFFVFDPIFFQSMNFRLEPGIEGRRPQGAQEFTHSMPPTPLLFFLSGSDEIHGPGQINSSVSQQFGLHSVKLPGEASWPRLVTWRHP